MLLLLSCPEVARSSLAERYLHLFLLSSLLTVVDAFSSSGSRFGGSAVDVGTIESVTLSFRDGGFVDSLVEMQIISLTRVVACFDGVMNVLMSDCLEPNVVVAGDGGYAFVASDFFLNAAFSVAFAVLDLAGDSSKSIGGVRPLAWYALIWADSFGTTTNSSGLYNVLDGNIMCCV
jgi:hypothetical protein